MCSIETNPRVTLWGGMPQSFDIQNQKASTLVLLNNLLITQVLYSTNICQTTFNNRNTSQNVKHFPMTLRLTFSTERKSFPRTRCFDIAWLNVQTIVLNKEKKLTQHHSPSYPDIWKTFGLVFSRTIFIKAWKIWDNGLAKVLCQIEHNGIWGSIQINTHYRGWVERCILTLISKLPHHFWYSHYKNEICKSIGTKKVWNPLQLGCFLDNCQIFNWDFKTTVYLIQNIS